ncbi:MAG TPA: SDR family oxidoreductase [Acidobacteriaceae bacterium]|nr:SDR family oxidoreductase [Acidobacteriaceae bacterium]
MNEYFVTGATGVVGSAIVRNLLSQPGNRVTLLVRADSDERLTARREQLLHFWQIGDDSVGERVKVLRGDTTLPRFGFSPAVFDRLAQHSTHVIHCAALVRMNSPLDQALKSAVGAAENIVHLARCCKASGRLRKIEYLSTVGVGGRLPGKLPERWITAPRAFHNTYEHAKADAESCIRDAIAEGIPITVHRPSMVVGESRSGRIIGFQVFYHLVEFLSGIRTFGVFPSFGNTRLDIVPVDYVADAVVWSSTQECTIGHVLHLCSGPDGSIAITELHQRVRRQWPSTYGRLPRTIKIPKQLFRALLPVISTFSSSRLRRAINTLPIFLDYLAEDQAFASSATVALLKPHGIAPPAIDSYLPAVLAYYFANRKVRGGG